MSLWRKRQEDRMLHRLSVLLLIQCCRCVCVNGSTVTWIYELTFAHLQQLISTSAINLNEPFSYRKA